MLKFFEYYLLLMIGLNFV